MKTIQIIRSKWGSFNAREKAMVSVGCLLVIVFVFMYGFYLPLKNNTKMLEQDLVNNRELLEWMQEQAPRLKVLQLQTKNASGSQHQNSTASLFSVLENFFNDNEFKDYPSTFNSLAKSGNKEQVAVNFNEVPFDLFMGSLARLQAQNNLVLVSFDVQALDNPGLVKMNAVFSR